MIVFTKSTSCEALLGVHTAAVAAFRQLLWSLTVVSTVCSVSCFLGLGPVALFILLNACSAEANRHRSLSSAAAAHQPGNRTLKFPHPSCRLLFEVI